MSKCNGECGDSCSGKLKNREFIQTCADALFPDNIDLGAEQAQRSLQIMQVLVEGKGIEFCGSCSSIIRGIQEGVCALTNEANIKKSA
ncbi:MAG: hypothetical protein N4A36_02035 [Candidatus Gracilibacteria bacterium]|jgi:hypothetical protein|nr:hypothetical protein [Candidatus Gracilibacteria bacterium]